MTEGLAVAVSHPATGEASFRASAGRRGLAGATTFPSTKVFYTGDDDVVSQHYGMGYLAMAYLIDKRGERAVLDVVRKVERSGDDVFAVLGVPQRVLLDRVKAWAGA